MIRLATKLDIKGIETIFRERFTTDQDYLNMVFTYLFPMSKCYVYTEDKQILSTLFLIPIKYNTPQTSYKGYYMYGVATLKSASNRGLAKKIIQYIKEETRKEGGDFIICKPAEKSLFKYYSNLGYSINIPKTPFTISEVIKIYLSNTVVAAQLLQEDISKQPYNFMWDLNILEYMINIGEIEAHIRNQYKTEAEYLLLNPVNPTIKEKISKDSVFLFPME